MVKYSWASYKNRPVHIQDITVEMRKEDKFYNLHTGKKMTAYLNGKFQRHFHHIEYTAHDNESYLHETAKAVFKDTYLNCLANGFRYEIEFWKGIQCRNHFANTGIICHQFDSLETYDLTKKFTEIKVEKKFNEFQPDIQLLSLKGTDVANVIFVEIYVTHKSSDRKVQQGQRIIEIQITNEDDILKLRKHKVSVSDDQVKFHNFNKTVQTIDYCSKYEKGCRTIVDTFVLYKNGAYEFLNDGLENIVTHIESEERRIAKVDFRALDKYYEGTPEAEKKACYIDEKIKNGERIKDCRYCKYKADKVTRLYNGLFCKFLRRNIEYSTAWDCKYYRVN